MELPYPGRLRDAGNGSVARERCYLRSAQADLNDPGLEAYGTENTWRDSKQK